MSTHAADQVPDPEPVPGTEPVATPRTRRTLEKSKTGYTWVGLVVAALLGIVLLIFILQNLEQVEVDLLFWTFGLPLGVSVLLSVIAGALVMALVGGVRIMQLRRAAKRP
ncbi:LapA family protein [Nocardia cyriacigeorgica]|uniref:LapA family protein n=1 Tax=Nocardia cyriacigeorgica TaxID=135487 RepID=UPI0024555124|nr:lipopolysaccharide assembly protein LapA domain-containing protein [Nocardia cyriacigeorgica]